MNHIVTAMVIGVISVNCISKTDLNLLETSDKIKLLYRYKHARAQQYRNVMPQMTKDPYMSHPPQRRHSQMRQTDQNTLEHNTGKRHSIRSAKGKAVALALPSQEKPFEYYKVLVVAAPPEVHMSGKGSALLIYIVFPDDGGRITDDLPTVYFVSTQSTSAKLSRSNKKPLKNTEPILIIDNNRKVTGLKSKHVAKYVTFKNKFSIDNFTFSEV